MIRPAVPSDVGALSDLAQRTWWTRSAWAWTTGGPRASGRREENTRAVRLYESVGFRRVGTTAFTIGSMTMEDRVKLLERMS